MIDKQYVEAIIGLTEQFNQQLLLKRFTNGVGEVAPCSEVKVFDIFNAANEVEFSAANIGGAMIRDTQDPQASGRWLQEEEGFVRAVTEKKLIQNPHEDDSKTRLVFPILGLNHTVGLVVVECDKADAENMYLLEALVKIYGNQNFLLTRNERDGLTGLMNRAAFDDRLSRIMGQLANNKRSSGARNICLAILDIDYFKQVNDEFGHLLGDEVLLHFAQLMTRSFRHYDQLFRYGGEEFAVLLYDIDVEGAFRVLERFRTALENYRFPQVGQRTASTGVVQIKPNELPPLTIDKADRALYYAKRNGRNQVQAYERLEAEGKLDASIVATGGIELF